MKNILCALIVVFISMTGTAQQFKYDHNNPKIVSKAGGYQLTVGDLNAAIEYMEFILAQTLNSKFKQAAQVSLKQEFESSPNAMATEMLQVKQLLPSIVQMTAINQIASYRNQVIAALHTNLLFKVNRPILLQLIDQLNPVLVYDALSQMALTKRDIKAIMKLGQFSAKLMGQPSQVIIEKDIKEMAKVIEIQLYKMDTPAKQQLILLADQLPLVKAAYAQMPAQAKAQFKQQFITSMKAEQAVAQQTNNCAGCTQKMIDLKTKQTNGTITQSELMELQNEMRSRQNLMIMLSNTNLQTHAAMLNVIENMGRGDTYYKVDYKN